MSYTRLSLAYRLLGLAISAMFTLTTQAAETAAQAIQQLDAQRWAIRTISLGDLGILSPLTLRGNDTQRALYFPVPTDRPLIDASLVFDSHYLRSNSDPTTLLLSVNGMPVSVQKIDNDRGTLHTVAPIAQQTYDGGFIQLNANWSASANASPCAAGGETDEALIINPGTRISYRYDPLAATSLDSAWATLPGAPIILVSGHRLDRAAFDTAWRVGVALERAGKRTTIRALPDIGDVIDTTHLTIPTGLATVPAFAALTPNSAHTIANPAELGALIVLESPAVSGDLVVVDRQLQSRLTEALDALAQQLATEDTQAASAFSTWRTRRGQLTRQNIEAQQIALSVLGAHSVITIASGAGAQAAGIFNDTWRRILTSHSVRVKNAAAPLLSSGATIPLNTLSSSADSFDVVTRGNWTANFALSAVTVNGNTPNELTLDLAAAPDASTTRPVASMFLNNVLLAAKQLDADGQAERLTARIPGYALKVSNALRVDIQRQPVSKGCGETPQGYPVTVLPTSHMTLRTAEPDGTFVGLLPLLADTPDLIIPKSYLDNSPASLSRIIKLAVATGLSPLRADLQVIQDGHMATPSRPFLAMDTSLKGVSPKAALTQPDQLTIGGQPVPRLSIEGLDHLAVAEVVQSDKQDGVLWRSLGNAPVSTSKPYVLDRGDIAILGEQGQIAWIDSSNPSADDPPGADVRAFFGFNRYMSWGVPIAALFLLLFLVLLILAYRTGRRRQRQHPGDNT